MYSKHIFLLVMLVGILCCCSKKDDSSDDDPSGDSGSLTFYKTEVFPCNTITITLTDSQNSESSGTLNGSAVVTGTPQCDVPNTFTFLNLEYGVYRFEYTCGGTSNEGQISINSDCKTILMIN